MTRLLNHDYQKTAILQRNTNYLLFGANASLNLLLLFLTNRYIITFPVFEKSWADRLNPDQLNEYFLQKDQLAFLTYFALIFYLLIKYALIALILQLAADFSGYKLKFSNVIKVVMMAELLILFPQALKIIHFLNLSGFTVDDLRSYEPLSLAGLFLAGGSGPWQYPFQVFSLWEVIYWFLLADGLRQAAGTSFKKSFSLVLSSYVPSLLFWAVLVAFITCLIEK